MATYQNNNTSNVDTYSKFIDGKLSARAGIIKPTVKTIEAENLTGALRIIMGPEAGRYIKKAGWTLVSSTPPPPPPPSSTKVKFALKVVGFKQFYGELEKE